jgi:hypothetical protein
MNQIIDNIKTIISELLEPQNQLTDTLLKVQVLAFQLKNSKLKEWVTNEINGYQDGKIPDYRRVPTVIYGNIIHPFSGQRKDNEQLYIDYLDIDLQNRLKNALLRNSISILIEMINSKKQYQLTLSHYFCKVFTQQLTDNYQVTDIWQRINTNDIVGIITSIKSNLLNFLLELAEELGEHQNIDIMKEKPKIDNLFDKTIGQITGNNPTINITTIGGGDIQSLNIGSGANINVSKGNNNSQTININDIKKELENFIADFKATIDTLDVSKEDKEDIITAITEIETQLQSEKPKYPMITQSLDIVKGILIGVAGNAVSPTIIEKIGWLIAALSSI